MKSFFLAGAGALLLGACAKAPAALPDTAALQSAAAQSGPYRTMNYQSPLAGFETYEPSGPASWRGVNEQQQENH
ncbi:hypothetical protein J4729_20935 [Leisingera sp. HS039]|uniref:hypothetical protein n=1 Tax=unclassified Leisingera TaxID=2614906 RepID=UPI0010708554|nr:MULTISPECIES: hypothetical protein [unclassified Leisingera]MBQ4826989.1 hypothetical protein [Leisingera sp. HS039]QBR35373.1 hypothetical protein ETW23_03690 [Leisingera sp. NJS201]